MEAGATGGVDRLVHLFQLDLFGLESIGHDHRASAARTPESSRPFRRRPRYRTRNAPDLVPDNEFGPPPRPRAAPTPRDAATVSRSRGMVRCAEIVASPWSSFRRSTPATWGRKSGRRPGRPVTNPWTLPLASRYSPVTCPASLIPIGEVSAALGRRNPIHTPSSHRNPRRPPPRLS